MTAYLDRCELKRRIEEQLGNKKIPRSTFHRWLKHLFEYRHSAYLFSPEECLLIFQLAQWLSVKGNTVKQFQINHSLPVTKAKKNDTRSAKRQSQQRFQSKQNTGKQGNEQSTTESFTIKI